MEQKINIQSYKKLYVYQKSKDLVLLTYKLTKLFPIEEKFVLIPQSRRAAISIVSNIVEGYFRTRKEFVRFINISIASALELTVQIDIAFDLKYLENGDYNEISNLLIEVRKLLFSYQKSLRNKK
ncbi:hypothetical protein A3A76_02195 [Candidatus Woesebacteria bacterium RIFCSPLOWO2_01_FULL_39_23]|uniref:Four helix bundle protein n=1 Tax=Candidatus Woesebacteria bacterium RIFCSPHIGHO2_01_FULL_40_22 TaxID=1802499 RepID=A0A1F7YFV2_9BACT|nr:MAG: hypothetical protein A2141_03350 [Candidatus Woesebacteria bacterium RBG_16_40_11]OGM26211.1 MAG: hypothetical protein A2628_02630 [Candidatus Woesebacteria bacterium RIFCSPHIGHO2_01_FULL_40_22]OGM36220.1 MAG: hypothetical protein A3E41_02005 [Candidatus Woesebacteria bacterium RIFCSPHIGHO2_12_FULL_38_9]OGM62369.1 MAG: hypothetical protein A3A76_02195 [Candidatus Woesebacteria bacterium RIFCSPLOWO2_01_FULL_39_23]